MRRVAFLGLAVALLTAAIPARDYWVDGKAGSNAGDGSRARPWQTLAYALSQIKTPSYPQSHRLRIVGAQVYVLRKPLTMKYNVALQGELRGGRRPVLRGSRFLSRLVRYEPTTIYNRREAGISDIDFEGAGIALQMGGNAKIRQRPAIQRCSFVGQQQAAVRMDLRGDAICDPRFFACLFKKTFVGIDAAISGQRSVLHPIIEECDFTGMSEAGYRFSDSSSTGSDVGGVLEHCRFRACKSGVSALSGPVAARTRLEIRSCWFWRCTAEAIGLRVVLQGRTAIQVQACSFVEGGVGLRLAGLFAPCKYSVHVTDCLAVGNRGAGFHYDISRAAPSAVRLELRSLRNLAVANERGFFVDAAPAGKVELDFLSDGDRAFANLRAGIFLRGGGASTAAWVVRSGIFARNQVGIRLATSMRGKLAFCSVADQSGTGLVEEALSFGRSQYLLEHSIFDRNRKGALKVPQSFRADYCCFDKLTLAGKGNLRADPRLVRPFYVLGSKSPCRDAGLVARGRGLFDFEGDARELGKAPDLGADEFAAAGSAHPYGVSGFGAASFQPELQIPKAQSGFRIGKSVAIELHRAIDWAGKRASGALLLIGDSEGPASGPVDLSAAGAPSSLLQIELNASLWPITLDAQGKGALRFTMPNDKRLLGFVFSAQYFVAKPGANAAGWILTRGLRVRIGQ